MYGKPNSLTPINKSNFKSNSSFTSPLALRGAQTSKTVVSHNRNFSTGSFVSKIYNSAFAPKDDEILDNTDNQEVNTKTSNKSSGDDSPGLAKDIIINDIINLDGKSKNDIQTLGDIGSVIANTKNEVKTEVLDINQETKRVAN
mmetsp:Transcript_30890/g.28072  ORF Transcript_30890/g.28072 Transcript_30890/m.28072 type:complete len:144 (-) Transcript_30890:114-545(-)